MSQSDKGEFYPILYQLVDGYVKYKLNQEYFKDVLCKKLPNVTDPHATAVYLKIIGDEITASNRKLSNLFSSASSERVILDHDELFSDETFDANLHVTVGSLHIVITEMGKSIFQSTKHRGTYAAFLAFGACLAVYCAKRKELFGCVDQVAHLITEYMCKELYSWFKEKGGWEKLGQAYVEDLQYYTGAQQRQVKYSQTCGLESYKLFSAKQYLGAHELAKKAVELLQCVPIENEVSASSCSSFARTMVFAVTMVEDQNMALSLAKNALWVVKNSPHLAVKLRFGDKRNVVDLNLALSALGEFFFDAKRYEDAIWCLSNTLKIIEMNDSQNSFDAELNYVLGVALLKLTKDGTEEIKSTGSQSCGIDEAVAVLKKAAKMFKFLRQHKANLSVEQSEDFLIAESDCYYYIGKAFNWSEDFGHSHEVHQAYLANRNEAPAKGILRTPLGTHRRASWSEAPDMAKVKEPMASELENTENSTLDGSKEVAQNKVTHLSRERIAVDNLDGKVDLQISDQVPPEILARGKEACDAFNKALKEGKTHDRRIPLMILGQNRSGKTSLKKSLIREKFNPEEDSTQGIEVDPSLCKITTNIWRTDGKSSADDAFSYEYRAAKLVVHELNSIKKEQPQDQFPQDTCVQERYGELLQQPYHFSSNLPTGSLQLETTAVVDGSKTDITSGEEEKRGETTLGLNEPSSHSRDWKSIKELPSSSTEIKLQVPENISVLIEKLLYEKDQDTNSEELYLKIWDFAGQSVYYATHPVFLSPEGIFLLTHNLNKDLYGKAAAVVKQGSFKRVEDCAAELTNMDVLHLWMSSIASLHRANSRSNSEILPAKLPPAILVCTHGDKPFEGTNSRDVAREILLNFERKKYKDHLMNDYFIVDNTKAGSKSDFEDKEVQRLRKFIQEIAEASLSVKSTAIPIRWYQFEKAIQSLCADGFKLLKLSQGKEIAQNVCGISDEKEFQTLLNFLHDNRMLIHFDEPKELNNLIILDTQWLIDVFKGVITIVPIECQKSAHRKNWERLENDGVLTRELALHVWKGMIQETDTIDGLLSVMEKFSLLCRWPTDDGEELYLVPSMLKPHPTGEFYSTELGSDAPPLFVRFTEDQVPIGLFPRLLIHFVHWCSEKWSKKNQPRLFCNIARFYIGDSGEYSVVVASHQSVIKITILKEEAQLSFSKNCSIAPICKELKGFLEQTLSSMGKEFTWMNTKPYEFCVRCTVCSTQICRQHNVRSCTQDICQHFVSEEELRKSVEESIKCYECETAMDTTLNTKPIAKWFDFLKDEEKETDLKRREMEILSAAEPEVVRQDVITYAQAVSLCGQTAVGNIFPTIMKDLRLPVPANYTPEQLVSEGAIALTRSEMEEFISTSSADEIVNTLADRLNVDYKELEEPDSQTCRIVRCFSHCVRESGRTDVLQTMKRRLSAGTAGPLLAEDTLVRNLPHLTLSRLGIALSGGEDWKQLAAYLHMPWETIRFLDSRSFNPGAIVVECLASLTDVTVGELYDILRYCGLESLSEIL